MGITPLKTLDKSLRAPYGKNPTRVAIFDEIRTATVCGRQNWQAARESLSQHDGVSILKRRKQKHIAVRIPSWQFSLRHLRNDFCELPHFPTQPPAVWGNGTN